MDALEKLCGKQLLLGWMLNQPQVSIPLAHRFCGDIWEREIFIPANTLVMGKVHKTSHLAKLVQGTMTIASSDGVCIFIGPVTFESKPDEQRAAFAHTDCIFCTFHVVGAERDISILEDWFVYTNPPISEDRP